MKKHYLVTTLIRGVADCDAPELVQGVYLRVLRHAKVFRDAGSFNAWLACLTRCEVIDAVRRRRRRSWLNERFQQWQEARNGMNDSPSYEELEQVLHRLDDPGRELVTQHYIDGLSQQSLADRNQTSVKAVESKLARLRKQLRRSLEKLATNQI